MTDMIWIPFALAAAFFHALKPLISEYFKVQSLHLLFWMRAFAILFLLPVVLSMPVPGDVLFYVFLACTIAAAAYFDIMAYGVSARDGAGVLSRITPMVIFPTFFLWFIVRPETVIDYWNAPVRTLGITAALVGAVYFALRLQKCPISKNALKDMAKPILLASIFIIFGKLAMDHSPLHSGVYWYVFLQSLGVFAVYGVLNFYPKLKALVPSLDMSSALTDKRVIIAGIVLSLVWTSSMVSKYYAFAFVSNPAFVALMDLTSPLWVLLIYGLIGRREKAYVLSGLGIVGCVALLVVFKDL